MLREWYYNIYIYIITVATKAMQDAGVKYGDIEQVVVGYVYGKTLRICFMSFLESSATFYACT